MNFSTQRTVPAGIGEWLPNARRSGQGMPMLCFPPAGAGAGFFRGWRERLGDGRIVPVQLPGREERFTEPAMEDTETIAARIAADITKEDWPHFVLLGYSYGALLAFETAHELERLGDHRTSRVIVCARATPQFEPLDTVADWPDDELLEYVRRLGGLPPEVEEFPEFVKLLLSVLRADFRANDLYSSDPNTRINAPITTIIGSDDPATADGRATGWADRTRGSHHLYPVRGGHFFILDNGNDAFRAIANAAFSDLALETAEP